MKESITPLICALALTSCSSVPQKSLSLAEYEALSSAAPLKVKFFAVTCSVTDRDGRTCNYKFPKVQAGQPITGKRTWYHTFPSQFDPPQLTGHFDRMAGLPSLTPSTPRAFAEKEIGEFLDLKLVPRGPFVEVSGVLSTVLAHQKRSLASGEAHSPIYFENKRHLLTGNEVPLNEFTRMDSDIRICGRPGISHRLTLANQRKTVWIICEPVNQQGKKTKLHSR
jgi:hypothetical protein